MTDNTKGAAEIGREIRQAFPNVPAPTSVLEMLLPPYQNSIDATEMAAQFVGRVWHEIPSIELFRHREMLSTMSAAAYRALLPAYLLACVDETPASQRNVGDMWEYTYASLKAWQDDGDADGAALAAQRLELLDERQRDAVRSVLRYIAARTARRDVQTLLDEW